MKREWVTLALSVSMAACVFGSASAASPAVLVLKDFEGKLTFDAKTKTVKDARGGFYSNFYCGPTSTIGGGVEKVAGAVGESALHVKWNCADYAGCGFSVPAKVFTSDYTTFRFRVKGTGSYLKYKVILADAGNETFISVFEDDDTEWKTVEIPIADFQRRTDYQPANSDNNATMDFPITNFNLEVVDNGELELWVDQIEAVK